jgi:hypothetical protein
MIDRGLTTEVLINVAVNGTFNFVNVRVRNQTHTSSISVTEEHIMILEDDHYTAARYLQINDTLVAGFKVVQLSYTTRDVKHVLVTSHGTVTTADGIVTSTVCEGSLVGGRFSDAVEQWQHDHSGLVR